MQDLIYTFSAKAFALYMFRQCREDDKVRGGVSGAVFPHASWSPEGDVREKAADRGRSVPTLGRPS